MAILVHILAAILDFRVPNSTDVVIDVMNGFLDIKNIWVDTIFPLLSNIDLKL